MFAFIFFSKFISIFIKDQKVNLFSSLLFCLAIQNTIYGFDTITVFYISYLSQKKNLKISNLFILFYAAANSDLAYNFYVPFISFLLLILIKSEKKVSYKILLHSSLIYFIFLTAFNLNLIQLFFSEIIPNKSSIVWPKLSFYEFIYFGIKNFLQINTITLSDPYKFFRDFPYLFYHTIPLLLILFLNNNIKNKAVLIYLILILFHLFLKTEVGFNLRNMFKLTKELRITIIYKYILLFSPIFFAIFYDRYKNFFLINKYLFITIFLLIISTPGPIFLMKFFDYSSLSIHDKKIAKKLFVNKEFIKLKDYLSENRNKQEEQLYSRRSFKGYYNFKDYQFIKEIIGDKVAISLSGPENKIDPMKAVYFNIRTIDGYFNYYSQSHKDSFLKIIEKEYKNKPKKFNYFKNWGQRIYITTFDTNNIKLNFDILKKLDVTYVIAKDLLKDQRLLNICISCGSGRLNLYKIR